MANLKVFSISNEIWVTLFMATQISLYSYQALGEHNAQLAVVKEHEIFIKQILLKEIEYKGNKHSTWKLINSSGNSAHTPKDFGSLPMNLHDSCSNFIESKNNNSTNHMEVTPND